MTGRYLIPLKNRTHLCLDSSLYPVLFYNAIPNRILRPFKNDRQAGFFTSFKNDRQVFNTVKKQNPPLLSFLSGGQNRNGDRRKNII